MLPRSASVLVFLALLGGVRASQAVVPPARNVVAMTISPAAVPVPALRLQLLPELAELEPGNAVLGYLKCFGERQKFFHHPDEVARRDQLLEVPLAQLPDEVVRDYGGTALRQADHAARLEHADWQVILPAKREGYRLLLPEIQQLRLLATALRLRCRGEIKLGEHEQALGTLKTLFALSRHLGDHPTLIGNLVGTSIATAAASPLEELLQQPGSPNLFWALRSMPQPLIDYRAGLGGERLLVGASLRQHLAKNEPISEAALAECIAFADELIQATREPQGDAAKKSTLERLQAAAADAKQMAEAKRELRRFGVTEEQLAKLSPLHLLLLREYRQYEEVRDDMMKLMHLPYAEAEEQFLATMKRVEDLKAARLFVGMVPAAIKVRQAQIRLEQRLAALAVVEALRNHLATSGSWPAALSEVALPLPLDPVSGKPFTYRVEGGKAVLENALPRGPISGAFPFRLELTARK